MDVVDITPVRGFPAVFFFPSGDVKMATVPHVPIEMKTITFEIEGQFIMRSVRCIPHTKTDLYIIDLEDIS